MVDYTKGRYDVYDSTGELIGRIDEDEFVRSGMKLLYRLDGEEVYTVPTARLVGFIEGNVVRDPKTHLEILKFVPE
ncbi:hypothetical protein ACOTJD_09970 [Achromobacter xylosoxidans]